MALFLSMTISIRVTQLDEELSRLAFDFFFFVKERIRNLPPGRPLRENKTELEQQEINDPVGSLIRKGIFIVFALISRFFFQRIRANHHLNEAGIFFGLISLMALLEMFRYFANWIFKGAEDIMIGLLIGISAEILIHG
jgi:hypothetical protein